MKTVKVLVSAVREGDVVSGAFTKQRKRGDTWLNVEQMTLVSGDPSSDRTFILGNDERLVIEGAANSEIVYDHNQKAAMRRELPPAPPTKPGPNEEDFSPEKPAVDRAMEPNALTEAQMQERRDAALTAARQKLAAQTVAPVKPIVEPTQTELPLDVKVTEVTSGGSSGEAAMDANVTSETTEAPQPHPAAAKHGNLPSWATGGSK